MYYVIYRITNILNGKTYIGKHETNNLDDDYMGSGKHIKRAIKKYGIENFIKEILYVYDNEDKMNLAEKILVVVDKEISYNIAPGGNGGFGYINKNNLSNTEELKNQKSKKMKEYWTEDKKEEKSKNMIEYNIINGSNRYSIALKNRWNNISEEKYNEFIDKMIEVNNNEEKRKDAGLKIKEKWKEPEFRLKAISNRLGYLWWNNGIEEIKSKSCPGDEWIRGRANKNLGRKKK